ncbi:MAG: hypothetical protein EXR11_06450 [Rhodospirillaceae bacterium]|nr:hypothetical protein [Rhodospirillaceae bacterium]
MAGTYRMDGNTLAFRPQFPLEPGVTYRAEFRLGDERARAVFAIPKPDVVPSTHVLNIYPTTSVLPENTLKLYIHFSAPIARGGAYRWIHLIDDTGAEVQLPFLELDEELWDPQFQRLTVLFDPGRIKRELVPNQEMGPPLVAGRTYTLVIDQGWPDVRGAPLREGAQKKFKVGPPDRVALDLKNWKVTAPNGATRQPVMLDFPEPIDQALLERLIAVTDASGQAVRGAVNLDRGETRWMFTPELAWRNGSYLLVIPSTLEDLAGNMVGRLFDVDTFDRVQQHITVETHTLAFTVAR